MDEKMKASNTALVFHSFSNVLKFGVSQTSHRHDGGGELASLLFFDSRLRAFLPEGTVSPGFVGAEPGWNFRHVGFHQSLTRTLPKNNRKPRRT